MGLVEVLRTTASRDHEPPSIRGVGFKILSRSDRHHLSLVIVTLNPKPCTQGCHSQTTAAAATATPHGGIRRSEKPLSLGFSVSGAFGVAVFPKPKVPSETLDRRCPLVQGVGFN